MVVVDEAKALRRGEELGHTGADGPRRGVLRARRATVLQRVRRVVLWLGLVEPEDETRQVKGTRSHGWTVSAGLDGVGCEAKRGAIEEEKMQPTSRFFGRPMRVRSAGHRTVWVLTSG